MKTLFVGLVLLLAAPIARAQALRLGGVDPLSRESYDFYREADNTLLISSGVARGRSIARVRVNGRTFTLTRTTRQEQGDWTTTTFRSPNGGVLATVRYRWTSAMGGESDCAHGSGTLVVRQGASESQAPVTIAVCPDYIGE